MQFDCHVFWDVVCHVFVLWMWNDGWLLRCGWYRCVGLCSALATRRRWFKWCIARRWFQVTGSRVRFSRHPRSCALSCHRVHYYIYIGQWEREIFFFESWEKEKKDIFCCCRFCCYMCLYVCLFCFDVAVKIKLSTLIILYVFCFIIIITDWYPSGLEYMKWVCSICFCCLLFVEKLTLKFATCWIACCW